MAHCQSIEHSQATRRTLFLVRARFPLLAFSRTLLLVIGLAASSYLQASAGGRSDFSGSPSTNAGATCAVCHAPDGATLPAIGIVGPDVIDAGTTQNYYVVMLGVLPKLRALASLKRISSANSFRMRATYKNLMAN